MPFVTKKEADAYDRVIDAAAELTELIEQSEIQIGDDDLERLTIFLAQKAAEVKAILKSIRGKPWLSPPASNLHTDAQDRD